MKNWKSTIWFFVLFGVVLISSSCDQAKVENSEVFDKLKLGYMSIAECLPVFVAIEKGFFSDEKLDVELKQFPGGAPSLEALRADSIQIAFSNLISLIFAVNAGEEFVAVYGKTIEDLDHILHGLFVRIDSSINTVADLRNKTIAINTFKNIDELLILDLLKYYEIYREDVELVEIPFPNMPAVLKNKDVDAISVVEPFYSISLTGNKLIANYFVHTSERTTITSYCAKASWVKQSLEVLEKFCRAMNRALDYCESNEPEARRALMKYTKLSESLSKEITLPVFSKDLPNAEEFNQHIEKMNSLGWINTRIDPQRFFFSGE